MNPQTPPQNNPTLQPQQTPTTLQSTATQQSASTQQPVAAQARTTPNKAHFDYAAIANRRRAVTRPIFWLLALGCGSTGTVILVLGGMMLDKSSFLGMMTMVVGLLFAICPATLYANKFKKTAMIDFANANSLRYEQSILTSLSAIGYNWMINQIQNLETVSTPEKLCSNSSTFTEMGNVIFTIRDESVASTTLSTETSKSYAWAYLRIPLPRTVPRMILDSLKNDGLLGTSKLPLKIDRGQRLSLEGVLDNYFALYAPMDYAQDAYYIFRTNILTVLMNYAQAYDLEIVDNDLFVYRHKQLHLDHPADIEEMATIADYLQPVFYESTKRYKDSFGDVLTDDQRDTHGQSLQTS